jgi:hypothetical protein
LRLPPSKPRPDRGSISLNWQLPTGTSASISITKPQYQHVNFEKGRLLVCLPAKLSLLSIARILVELYKRSHVRRQNFSSPLQRKSWFVELVFHVVGVGSLALAKLTPELNLVRASLNDITSKRKHKQEWGQINASVFGTTAIHLHYIRSAYFLVTLGLVFFIRQTYIVHCVLPTLKQQKRESTSPDAKRRRGWRVVARETGP